MLLLTYWGTLMERKPLASIWSLSKSLKLAARIVAPSLTAIFTKSAITGIYSTEWKMARITSVFKKSVKSELNNYCPISVIPVVAKVFEKIVYHQQYLNDAPEHMECVHMGRVFIGAKKRSVLLGLGRRLSVSMGTIYVTGAFLPYGGALPLT